MGGKNRFRRLNAPRSRPPLITQKTERAWSEIRIEPFHVGVVRSPNDPALYESSIEGQRSDGLVFGVPIMLRKERIDVLTSGVRGMEITVHAINTALAQLNTFRDCKCSPIGQCDLHKDMVDHRS